MELARTLSLLRAGSPTASWDPGRIGVVELDAPVDMARVQPAFVERGVWIRPFGKLVYTMPPFTIGEEDLTRITDAIYGVLSETQVSG